MRACARRVLADRGRAAAALRAWGAARISASMAASDIVALLHSAQIGCADISALLLEFVSGPQAVVWVRALRLLQDDRYAAFMRKHGAHFLPKLIFCAAPVIGGGEPANDSDAEVCVALPDSQ